MGSYRALHRAKGFVRHGLPGRRAPVKAMLLCAGRGNRLRPLSVGRAKPVMPLLGRPLVLSILDRLVEASVDEVVVNLHHLPETVRSVVESHAPAGLSIRFSEERQILGTAGGLKEVEHLFQDEDEFLLVNGDCYYGFPFGPLVARHREARPLATMALRAMPPAATFAPVELDGEKRIVRIAGRPPSPVRSAQSIRMFVGVHVLSRDIWSTSARGQLRHQRRRLPFALAARGAIVGLESALRGDLGTPQRYLRANLDLLAQLRDADRAPMTRLVPRRRRLPGRPGRTPSLAASLGENVRVERGARIADSVILEGAGSAAVPRSSDRSSGGAGSARTSIADTVLCSTTATRSSPAPVVVTTWSARSVL
ncbi:MAG: sugar phosphate nucleotidyltransferase [Acidobacteriota bacterium]